MVRQAGRQELRWRLSVLIVLAVFLIAWCLLDLDFGDAAWSALLLLGSVSAQYHLHGNRR